MIKLSKLKRIKRKTREKGKRDRLEWALVSKKNPKKILKWFGPEKPSKKMVAKEERRIHAFSSINNTRTMKRDYNMINDLVNIANALDKKGLKKEADYLDSIIRVIAQEETSWSGEAVNPVSNMGEATVPAAGITMGLGAPVAATNPTLWPALIMSSSGLVTLGAIAEGMKAWSATNEANSRALSNMVMSSLNRSYLSMLNRRKAGGEDTNFGSLAKDIDIWGRFRRGDSVKSKDFQSIVSKFTPEDRAAGAVQPDPGGYGDVDKAKEAVSSLLELVPYVKR